MVELSQSVLEHLATCSDKERTALYAEIGKTEWSKCADDPMYWLDATRHFVPYVYTRDPKPLFKCRKCDSGETVYQDNLYSHLELRHDIVTEVHGEVMACFEELPTSRAFTIFPYVPPIVNAWLREKIVFIEKSRDMMATWLVVALYTWDTLFHKNRENIFQSDDTTKALDLVERGYFIWDNQPAFLKNVQPATFAAGSTRSGIMRVPGLSSIIYGFPGGSDQIRQFHPTGLFQDEAAFQPEFEASFMAAKPAIQAGGRLTAVSSANPGWFYKCVRDLEL